MARLLLPLLLSLVSALALERSELYPVKPEKYVDGDDNASERIQLKTPIRFLTKTYYDLWVNTNGYISFENEDRYLDESTEGLPTGKALLAPFYADLNPELGGYVTYEETDDDALLDRTEILIRRMFYRKDRPTSLFIANWDSVPGYMQNEAEGQGNTFQVVIATNGYWSYVFFNFPHGGINWLSTKGKYTHSKHVYAKSGIMFDLEGHRSDWYHPLSNSEKIALLPSYSTKQTPGVYAYRIGGQDVSRVQVPPRRPPSGVDPDPRPETRPEPRPEPETTAESEPEPESTAEAESTAEPERTAYTEVMGNQGDEKVDGWEEEQLIPNEGHGAETTEPSATLPPLPSEPQNCQRCAAGEIWDGRYCSPISDDMVIAGVGKVSGSVNDVSLDDVRFQFTSTKKDGHNTLAFGVGEGHRALGNSLALLLPLTTSISYLFPELEGAEKGLATFMSQGYLTHDVNMLSGGSEQLQARLTLRFLSMKDQQLLYDVELQLRGRLQHVDAGRQVSFRDYYEDLVMEGNPDDAVVRGSSRLGYSVDGREAELEVSHTMYVRSGPQPACRLLPTTRVHSKAVSIAATPEVLAFSLTSSIDADSGTDTGTDTGTDGGTDGGSDGGADGGTDGGTDGGSDGGTQPTFTCLEANICSEFASCVQQSSGQYECECLDGYSGDGLTCEEEGPVRATCTNCDLNASCRFDVNMMSSRCICNEGYTGDGSYCFKLEEPRDPCADARCHEQAVCVPLSARDYRCECRQGYEGDGYTCYERRILDCREDPGLCSEYASCQLMQGRYTCVCSQGYEGDGRQCSWKHIPQADQLIVSKGLFILDLPLNAADDHKPRQIVYDKSLLLVGVEVECDTHDVFYTEVRERGIWKKSLSDGDAKLLTSDADKPEGIAVDWISNNLYVTDSEFKEISVMDYNGNNKIVLIDEGLDKPRAIVVDPVRGFMYWSDWQRSNPRIEMAEMDGSNRKVLVSDGLQLPNALHLDTEQQTLCWADAGTHTLECIRLDSDEEDMDRSVIARGLGRPFDIAEIGSKFYVTDWMNGHKLQVVDKETGDVSEVEPAVGGHGRFFGIDSVKPMCPRGSNRCAYDNGGCDHLCVPKAGRSHACLCPTYPNCN